jgi:hypothetical protein
MRCSITLYQFAKRTQITCDAVAKGNRLHPFDAFVCGNRELHATPCVSAMYRWENFIRNFKKDGQIKKNPFASAINIHVTAYPPTPLSGATVPLKCVSLEK